MVDRWVHDAHRITDSATAMSRSCWCSRSPAPMVWFRLLLRDDGFALVVAVAPLRAASAILVRAEEEAAVRPTAVASSTQ